MRYRRGFSSPHGGPYGHARAGEEGGGRQVVFVFLFCLFLSCCFIFVVVFFVVININIIIIIINIIIINIILLGGRQSNSKTPHSLS